MSALIPLHNGPDGVATVNARDLHSFLEVGTQFKDWIARRISDFGFTDGEDFRSFLSESPGGRPSKEYAITLDMAKELSMVERNDKGKLARRYFIECERRLQAPAFQVPQTLSDALRLAADLSDKVTAARAELAEAQPKVEFYDTVTASDTVCQMAVAAQVANLPFGRNILLQRLRGDGILISGGERHNLPKQQYIKQGLFTVKEHRIENPKTQEPIINFSTHVTQKGISWLVQRYGKSTQEALL